MMSRRNAANCPGGKLLKTSHRGKPKSRHRRGVHEVGRLTASTTMPANGVEGERTMAYGVKEKGKLTMPERGTRLHLGYFKTLTPILSKCATRNCRIKSFMGFVFLLLLFAPLHHTLVLPSILCRALFLKKRNSKPKKASKKSVLRTFCSCFLC